jgi:hypothetical protein
MTQQNNPAPAVNRREVVCDVTRNCHSTIPPCHCPACLVATAEAGRSRRSIHVLVLMDHLRAIDPSLTTAALMHAAGGGA